MGGARLTPEERALILDLLEKYPDRTQKEIAVMFEALTGGHVIDATTVSNIKCANDAIVFRDAVDKSKEARAVQADYTVPLSNIREQLSNSHNVLCDLQGVTSLDDVYTALEKTNNLIYHFAYLFSCFINPSTRNALNSDIVEKYQKKFRKNKMEAEQ